MFGLSSSTSPVAQQQRGQPPLTYLEQKRREAQYHYQEEQKYLRDNKEALDKLLEKEREAQMAGVPTNLWEAIDQISGKPKEPQAPGEGAEGAAASTTDAPTTTQK